MVSVDVGLGTAEVGWWPWDGGGGMVVECAQGGVVSKSVYSSVFKSVTPESHLQRTGFPRSSKQEKSQAGEGDTDPSGPNLCPGGVMRRGGE